jgi:hypothetical protein
MPAALRVVLRRNVRTTGVVLRHGQMMKGGLLSNRRRRAANLRASGRSSSAEIPGDVAVYEVPVSALTNSADGVLIAGQPTVKFEASTVAHRVQLDVRLFDVTPGGLKQLVTRGTYIVDTGSPATPIGRTPITIVTYGNVWQAALAGTLRLEITNVDTPYIAPSRIPSATELSKVSLDIPTR